MRLSRLAPIVSLCVAGTAFADITPITTVRVASGLVRPIGVFHAPGDSSRLFIIEKQGFIRILENGVLLPTAFLNVDAITGGGTSSSSEQGLLGLAFHPDFDNNGLFYIDHTNNSGNTVIAEYQISGDPNIADAGSRRELLTIAQPFSNHNGGWIDFGPDGYLYISMGDGGSAGDPGNRAQTITNQLLGKMLRIDVDGNNSSNGQYGIPATNPFVGVTGDDEIWAYGLRNAWRNSFDRQTGDLWIADVGQGTWEEVNFQSANSTGGENYGWRCYEGNANYNTSGCASPSTMVFPIHVYSHASGGCSITGGYVYRGCKMPENHGAYFFADYCSSVIWSLRYNAGVVTDLTNRSAELAPGGGLSITSITSFGEDANGEIYICDQGGGEIFKIVPNGPTIGDWNGDGALDFFDAQGFLADFSSQTARSDINDDGAYDFFDVQAFLQYFSTACP